MEYFLSFGKVVSPEATRQNEGAEVSAAGGGLGRQMALITAKTPAFCLNSPGWMMPGPELIAAMDSRADLHLLCHDRIKAMVPAFAPRVREFCQSYLNAIEFQIGPAEDGDSISLPCDRFFAALLPLPCPKIATPHAAGGWVEADLGFWDGGRLTLIRFGSDTAILPRQRAEIAALEASAQSLVRLLWRPLGAGPEAIPKSLMTVAENAKLPVFGPYRAPSFRMPLPDEAKTL